MEPRKVLFLQMTISAFQVLCCLPLLLFGFSKVSPLIVAVQSAWSGEASVAEVCWKILSVTGPLFMAIFVFATLNLLKGTIKPAPKDPSQAWLANPMWAAKHIRLDNRGPFWIVVLLLLFYLAIVVPFSIASGKTPFYVFCGVLGLVLLLVARVFWLNRKWNSAELRMAEVPGVIGGPFSGVAILQQSFPAGTAFDLCLKCEKSESHRAEGRSSSEGRTTDLKTTTETVWSSTITVDKPLPSSAPNQTHLPFSFAIPFDCEPTSDFKNKRLHAWYLVVRERGKVGYGGSVFTVPVFKTEESRPDFELDDELIEPFKVEVDVHTVLARVGLKTEDLAGERRSLLVQKWDLMAAVSMGMTSLVCMTMIVASFWYIRPIWGALFVAAIPAILCFSVGYAFLDMLLWRSLIEIERNGLSCESGWMGFRKSLTFNGPAMPVFKAELDRVKENGEWYRVDACKRHEDTEIDVKYEDAIPLIKKLDGRAEAEAVAEWLAKQCNRTQG
jgi:hypothetical protein